MTTVYGFEFNDLTYCEETQKKILGPEYITKVAGLKIKNLTKEEASKYAIKKYMTNYCNMTHPGQGWQMMPKLNGVAVFDFDTEYTDGTKTVIVESGMAKLERFFAFMQEHRIDPSKFTVVMTSKTKDGEPSCDGGHLYVKYNPLLEKLPKKIDSLNCDILLNTCIGIGTKYQRQGRKEPCEYMQIMGNREDPMNTAEFPEEFIEAILKKYVPTKQEPKPVQLSSELQNNDIHITDVIDFLQTTYKLLEAQFYDGGYWDWVSIIWSIKSYEPYVKPEQHKDLQKIADDFSRQSKTKYNEYTFRQKYLQCTPGDGITHKTYIQMLKQSVSEEKFNEIKKKYFILYQFEKYQLLHGDVADYVCEANKKEFMCVDNNSEITYYAYDEITGTWSDKFDSFLNKYLMHDVYERYLSIYKVKLQYLQALANTTNVNPDMEKKIVQLEKFCNGKIRTFFKNSDQMSKVIKVIKMNLQTTAKHIKMDLHPSQKYNIQFKNGCLMMDKFDLDKHHSTYFRKRNPDDYITMTLKYDYTPANTEQMEVFYDYFRKIQPNKKDFDFLMYWLAFGIIGRRSRQFKMNTGVGSNGKSSEMEIQSTAFDLYIKILPNSVFDASKQAGAGDKSLSNLHKMPVRSIIVDELSQDNVDVAKIKMFTGADNPEIQVLYSKNTISLTNNTTVTFIGNSFMNIKLEQAIVDRGLAMDYSSRFVSRKSEVDEENNVYLGNPHFKADVEDSDELKCAYATLVFCYARRLINNGLQIPNTEPYKQLFKQALIGETPITEDINEMFEFTGDHKNHRILAKTMTPIFKVLQQRHKKQYPNITSVKAVFTQMGAKYNKNAILPGSTKRCCWTGIRRIEDEESDEE